MSEIVHVQVFYGLREVRYSPEGIDLLDFSPFMKKC
jgi:hypothetical protein